MKRNPTDSALAAVALLLLIAAAAQGNELANPTFDTDVSSWDDTNFNDPEHRVSWIEGDGGPVSGPGCLEEGTTFNNGGSAGVFQDHPASPGESFVISGWSRIPSVSPGNEATLSVVWRDAENNFNGVAGETFNGDAGGGWHYHEAVVTAPAGTAVLRFRPSVLSVSSGSEESVARWDDLRLVPALIFLDDFETGDTSLWSSGR